MDIEREIELLKEKVALLEKIKELQDAIKMKECITIIPYIPYIPPPIYPWPYPRYQDTTTWSGTAACRVTPEYCGSGN